MQWGLNIGQQRLHFVQAHWNASYWVGSDVFWSIFSDYFFNDVSLWEEIVAFENAKTFLTQDMAKNELAKVPVYSSRFRISALSPLKVAEYHQKL